MLLNSWCNITYDIILTLWLADRLVYLIAIIWGYKHFYKLNKYSPNLPITIIKPLKGLETELLENLTSHFRLKNENLQILMCCASPDDPAVAACKQVMADFPEVDASIIITEGLCDSINPLVANLYPAFAHVKHGLIWVTTSRIVVSDRVMDDLRSLAVDPSVGIAHQMPFTVGDDSSLSAAVSTVFFGCFFSRWFIMCRILGINFFTGMSYMFERRKLEEIGPFDQFGDRLNEDLAFSECLLSHGYKHVNSSFPAMQNISHFTIEDNLQRHIRWAKMRLHSHFIVSSILEVLSTVVVSAVITAYVFPPGYALLGVSLHLCSSVLLDWLLLWVMENGSPRLGVVRYLGGWLAKEVGFIMVMFYALVDPTIVQWGGGTYRLHRRGIVHRIS